MNVDRPTVSRARVVADAIVLALFAAILWRSTQFHSLAGYFPIGVGLAGVILGACNLLIDAVRWRRGSPQRPSAAATHPPLPDAVHARPVVSESAVQEQEEYDYRVALRYVLWIAGYFAAILLVGMIIASTVLIVAFLLLEAHSRPLHAVLAAVIAIGALLALDAVFSMQLPAGLLTS